MNAGNKKRGSRILAVPAFRRTRRLIVRMQLHVFYSSPGYPTLLLPLRDQIDLSSRLFGNILLAVPAGGIGHSAKRKRCAFLDFIELVE